MQCICMPVPRGNAASETEMTGASSGSKNISNKETNKYCSNLARMAVRRGGLRESPGLLFLRMCNAMRVNRRLEQREPHKKCDEGKNNLFARWQASCEQEGEEAKGHTDEAEQMRKIVRYRKHAVPEQQRHSNGGRRGSRRKQAAT